MAHSIKSGKLTFEGETYSISTEDRLAAEVSAQSDSSYTGNNSFDDTTTFSGSVHVRNTLRFGIQTVAAAGSSQTTATAISASEGTVVNVTGADNTKGVILPPLTDVPIGSTFLVFNNLANKTLEIYPNADDGITVNAPGIADNVAITATADCVTLLQASTSGSALSGSWSGAEFAVIGA